MMELTLPSGAVLVSNSEFMRLREIVYNKWAEYARHNTWRACFLMIHDAECRVGPVGEKLWVLDSTVESPSYLLSFIDVHADVGSVPEARIQEGM